MKFCLAQEVQYVGSDPQLRGRTGKVFPAINDGKCGIWFSDGTIVFAVAEQDVALGPSRPKPAIRAVTVTYERLVSPPGTFGHEKAGVVLAVEDLTAQVRHMTIAEARQVGLGRGHA